MAYRTLTVGVGQAREAKVDQLEALAEKLNCRVGDLVWHGIDGILANPPATAPEGSRAPGGGSAPGFFVLPNVITEGKHKGRAQGFIVREVESRNDGADMDGADGAQFFRFKAGEEKERARSYKAALRAAAYMAKLAGLAADAVTSEVFEGLDESPAPAAA